MTRWDILSCSISKSSLSKKLIHCSIGAAGKLRPVTSRKHQEGRSSTCHRKTCNIWGGYQHVITGHSAFGKNILPRLAALLDVQQISDVMSIESEDSMQRSK